MTHVENPTEPPPKEAFPLFSEPAAGIAAESVHLEEAVLSGDVSLEEERVLDRGGDDVRDSERVASDRGALCDGDGDIARGLR